MGYVPIPATLFPLSIKTGSTWTPVGGLKTLSYSTSKQEADTTTFDTAGWNRSMITSRGATVSASGDALFDEDGVKDPGQAACEAAGDEIGAAAEATFRIALPSGDALEFTGTVTCTPFGGGVNAVAEWKVDITVTNPPTVENV